MELIPSNNAQQMQAQIASKLKQERIERQKAIAEAKKKANETQKPNEKSQLLQAMNMEILMGRNRY